MKYLLSIFTFLILAFAIEGCSSDTNTPEAAVEYQCPMQCEGDKMYHEAGTCPVCKMDLRQKEEKVAYEENEEISETSIFNLTSRWHTQDNEEILLKDLMGKPLVVVMIYTSCQAACPRLVADMRNIEADLSDSYKNKITYLYVSIDPSVDTPETLKTFAIANFMDDDNHVFLNGSEEDVREFSNVLAVKYKEISPIDFSHSNIISVFNAGGELEHQQEGLGIDNESTIKAIKKVVNN